MTSQHPADRLLKKIEQLKAPVCVGLDPVLQKLPQALRPTGDNPQAASEALLKFSQGVMEAVSGQVPCVKIQSACFERYGAAGVGALGHVIKTAETLGLEVILDAKRGDIGISAEHYAAAAFGPESAQGASQPAWITINAYLGSDGILPFLKSSHGAFALVRTSNPGGDALQELPLQNGLSIAEAVGEIVAGIGEEFLGEQGYSSLGAVVGATKPGAAKRLREIMPRQIFLVPGYGAQGGGVDDILPCFNADGRGAVVTASRSVIYAFSADETDWKQAVEQAAAKLAQEIGQAVGLR